MNAFWSYFWPPFGAGLVIGIIAGMIAVRVKIVRVKERPHEPDFTHVPRGRRIVALAGGVAASVGCAGLWHGPMGAADWLSNGVERIARQVLIDYEAPVGVAAHIHHGPLTRQLILSGPSNDFQRSEAARLLGQIPGVSSARWSEDHPGPPLIAEGVAVALLGFLLGLLIAYLRERRRRYNAQWNW
jgi:membrane protease YdiL (CAAX protease family)